MKQPPEMERPITAATRFGVESFDAPYLIERLLKEGVVDSFETGGELFFEFKRWLLLSQSDRSKLWPIFSSQVDAVWHHFILYTREYTAFCGQYFGRYVHHTPSNAPKHPDSVEMEVASFEVFCEKYHQTFGSPAPELWRGVENITLDRRILNSHAGQLQIRSNDLMLQLMGPEPRRFLLEDEGQMLHLVNSRGVELLRTGTATGKALVFLAETPAFYVRELPGDLAAGDKIALVSMLIEAGILKIAA